MRKLRLIEGRELSRSHTFLVADLGATCQPPDSQFNSPDEDELMLGKMGQLQKYLRRKTAGS